MKSAAIFLIVLPLLLLSCAGTPGPVERIVYIEVPVEKEPEIPENPVEKNNVSINSTSEEEPVPILVIGGILNSGAVNGEEIIGQATDHIIRRFAGIKVVRVETKQAVHDLDLESAMTVHSAEYGLFAELLFIEEFNLYVLQISSLRRDTPDQFCYNAAFFFNENDLQDELDKALHFHFPDRFDGPVLPRGSGGPPVILIDPGHGGNDLGAVSPRNINEKFYNNQLSVKIGDALIGRGFTVEYTKNPVEDIFITKEERVLVAEEVNPDLFVSVHHDSRVDRSLRGFSVFYSSYRPKLDGRGIAAVLDEDMYTRFLGERIINGETIIFLQDDFGDLQYIRKSDNDWRIVDVTPGSMARLSRLIAITLIAHLLDLEHVGPHFNYAADKDFYILRNSPCPAILIEAGFISNWEEEPHLAMPENQDAFAEAVADALVDFHRFKD